ncbi:YceD family protein [Petroclostridium xylanilyticum]|jgi:uncharacterized protein|uniref:YceD family protein n=1 Tax=Petroclostridium xylanilyticum TaxID=1792311 RepID=UPI000B993961|nr:DUF177 domain-containing protein [Petroclostridium xylanilyticum]
MVIDLSNALKFEGSKVDFDSLMEVEKIEFMGDQYKFLQPVRVAGSVIKVGDTLQLNAQVSGSINVNCYRCMKAIQKDFCFSMDEVLINDDLSDVKDEEAIHFKGSQIDIKEIVINNILLNISMKHLCSQECKGLCPQCGTDLNIKECECRNEDIDPRFEVLKKLLNNNEK